MDSRRQSLSEDGERYSVIVEKPLQERLTDLQIHDENKMIVRGIFTVSLANLLYLLMLAADLHHPTEKPVQLSILVFLSFLATLGLIAGPKFPTPFRYLSLVIIPFQYAFIIAGLDVHQHFSTIPLSTVLMISSVWLFRKWYHSIIYFLTVILTLVFGIAILGEESISHSFTPVPSILVTAYVYSVLLKSLQKEKKKAFERMIRLEQRSSEIQHLFEKFPLGILLVRKGQVRWWNQVAQEMFCGVFREGAPLDEVFRNEKFVQKVYSMENMTCEDSVELTISQFGQPITIQATGSHVTWKSETTLLVSLKDTTAEHRMDKFRTRWISTVSHEFRTPLNVILNLMTHLSTLCFEKAATSQFIKLGQSSAELLMTYVGDLLDYSQLQSQKFTVSIASFPLRECLEKCADILQAKAKDRNISLCVKVEEKVPAQVLNDFKRLQQILINLVGNALKFSPEGSEITIQAESNQVVDLPSVRISVIDRGIGIQSEDLQHLFQEFGRVKSTDNERLNPSGVGLGLWISNNLASRMGTRLFAFSKFGYGSTFVFDLLVDGSGLTLDEVRADLQSYEPKHNPYEEIDERGRIESTASSFSILSDEDEKEPSAFSAQRPSRDQDKKERRGGIAKVDAYWNGHKVTTPRRRPDPKSIPFDEIKSEFDESLTLLIVDDDYSNRFVLSVLCEQLNVKAEFASSGEQGLQNYKNSFQNESFSGKFSSRFDAIIMDYQMPEMSGPDVVKKIRLFERNGNCKRVLIFGHTAFSSEQELQEFKASGIDAVLEKPVNAKSLRLLLTQYLEQEY